LQRLLLSVVPILALGLLGSTICAADERIRCQTSGQVQTCRIDEPEVRKDHKQYPTILFHPGYFVTVHAGGCVQSGGHGQTWHRYVNPSGPDSDHLYHGLIEYPGSGGLIRFPAAVQAVGGWTFRIPNGTSDNTALVLGFEDTDYGDNGYWGHDRDNGPNGQCPVPPNRGGEPAWVSITISPTGTSSPNEPMDLLSDTVDPNGLPLNPWWAYERGVGRPAGGPLHPNPVRQCGMSYIDPDNVDEGIQLLGTQCTTQAPSVNQGEGLNGELCRNAADHDVLAGHLNWFISTYTGKIRWEGYSKPELNIDDPTKPGDDDYNFTLAPTLGTGLTATHPETIGLEFDSDEVVDRIDKGWWNDFHKLVDIYDRPGGAASQRIYDSPTIAIGVMGLDSEHGAYSELHPVYGLAMRVNQDAGHVGTDDWVFLARNFGNEGYCSQGILTAPDLTTLSFFIQRDNAIGDDPNSPTSLDELYSTSDDNSVAVNFVPGGAIISFDLGTPDKQAVYSGHVQFHWKLGTHANALTGIPYLDVAPRAAATVGKRPTRPRLPAHLPSGQIHEAPEMMDTDANELSTKVLNSFPAATQRTGNTLLVKKPAAVHAVKVRRVTRPAPPGVHKGTPRYIKARQVPDPARSERASQLLKIYCDTYPAGKSPFFTARSCTRVPVRPVNIHTPPGPVRPH
jgi:hypothetical protein